RGELLEARDVLIAEITDLEQQLKNQNELMDTRKRLRGSESTARTSASRSLSGRRQLSWTVLQETTGSPTAGA
ncbi:MAG: hypothetical protein GY826_19875, partial [Fuerstiella sp.]|nr:hypothetical protein [Fuerstiella sp.]